MAQHTAAVATDAGTANWTRWNKVEEGAKRADAREEAIAAQESNAPQTTTDPQTTITAFEQSERDSRRAEWEAFKFIPVTEGWVNVANTSHDEPKQHVYSVKVEDDEATQCSCPHDKYREGKCKHRRAVENGHL